MRLKLKKALSLGAFFLCLSALLYLGVWQLRDLMSPLRAYSRSEDDQAEDLWELGRDMLSPACMYLTAGDGGYRSVDVGSPDYPEMKELLFSLLDLGRSAGNGRFDPAQEFFQAQPALCCRYRFAINAELLRSLGFSEGLCQSLPEDGVRELWLVPSTLYWQDSSLYFVNRSADFCWKLTVTAERRGSQFQRLLDRFPESAASASADLLCAQQRFGLGGDAFFLAPDECAMPDYFLLRSGVFAGPEGSVNAAQTRSYALRLLRYSDTLRIWSIGFNSVLYTNENTTLRISSDGRVRYSAVALPDYENMSLAESFALASDFVRDAALSTTNTELCTVLSHWAPIEDGYQFDFDYYCRGVRLVLNDADTPALCVRVTKGIISFFSGDYVSVYRAVLNPQQRNLTQYDALVQALAEEPLAIPESVWLLSGDRFEAGLQDQGAKVSSVSRWRCAELASRKEARP